MNWQTRVRRHPCAFYARHATLCRWCKLLVHVRVQGASRTLCGHACTSMDGWDPGGHSSPEDVSAVDRCEVCFRRMFAIARRERRPIAERLAA